MRALILVGGFGTRLRPLTYTTPKQMLPIGDVPMIERKIEHLVSHGIDDIVFSMGYKPDAFLEAYPNQKCGGATFTCVVEPQPLGTAGAIAYAARQAGMTETFLAMNGDVLTDLDCKAMLEYHRKWGAEGSIALQSVDDPSRFGVVVTDDHQRITEFVEKPKRSEAPSNLINAGTYVLEPRFIDRVPEGRECSIEREIFPQVVADGGLYAGTFSNYWIDIGTPESYLQANVDWLNQNANGEPFVAADARVHSSAVLRRCVVGSGAAVGAGAKVTDAVLMAGAVCGEGTMIDGSIVGKAAIVNDGASVTGLSVVGDGLEVVADAVLDSEKVDPPAAAVL